MVHINEVRDDQSHIKANKDERKDPSTGYRLPVGLRYWASWVWAIVAVLAFAGNGFPAGTDTDEH